MNAQANNVLNIKPTLSIKNIISGEFGMGVSALAISAINFWAGVELNKAAARFLSPKKTQAEVMADEFEDELMNNMGLDVPEDHLEDALKLVTASYILGRDIINYKETENGRTIKPYAYLHERIRTPNRVILDLMAFGTKQQLLQAEAQAKLVGMDDEQLAIVKERTEQRLIAQAKTKAETVINELNSMYDPKAYVDMSQDQLIEVVEDCANFIDVIQLTKEAAKATIDRSRERLIAGEFVKVDPDVANFANLK